MEIDLSALTGFTRIASTATTTSVTSNIYTFADCKSLTRVVLPEGLTLIAGYVFDGCENLSSINLDNVEKFGNRVFTGTALTSVNLSVNLSSMGYLVFAGCPYLESVNVPSNCVAFSSEDGVLYNADGEIVCFPAGKEVEGGVLTLEEGVGVGSSAFAGCDLIEEVIIPEGITEIGQYAFYDSGIKRITIPASVVDIGTYAFAYSDIESVVIPATVTTIRSHAFDGSALQTATVEATAALASSTAQYIFANCELLTSVTFAEGTESIPSYAFLNCLALESIALPSAVTTIGGSAFSGSGLKTFTIGDGAENVVGGNVEWIGSSAFAGTRLVSVRFEIPELKASASNLSTTYTASLFSGCTELTTVTFSEGMTILGDDLFLNCPALTTVCVIGADGSVRGEQGVVTLPESLTEIASSAFENSGITSITLSASLTTIGASAFASTAIQKIVLLENVNSLGNRVFANCTSLTGVELPDRISSIPSGLFEGCTALTDFYIPASIVNVGADAFSGWTAEQTIYIGVSEAETLLWWNDGWKDGCNAKIIYNVGRENQE